MGSSLSNIFTEDTRCSFKGCKSLAYVVVSLTGKAPYETISSFPSDFGLDTIRKMSGDNIYWSHAPFVEDYVGNVKYNSNLCIDCYTNNLKILDNIEGWKLSTSCSPIGKNLRRVVLP